MTDLTKYDESLGYSFSQRLKWKIYKRLPASLARYLKSLRPKFADQEGENVVWFGLHCVQRRESRGFVSVGANSRVEGILVCHRHDSRIVIGERTSIGGGTVVESLRCVIIGDDCLVAHHVTIQDHDSHPLDWQYRSNDVINWLMGLKDWTHVKQADVVIERRCWIGTRSIVLKGVHLGEGCVVAAGSVVTKSFPPLFIDWRQSSTTDTLPNVATRCE